MLNVEEIHVDIEVKKCFLVFLVKFAFAINKFLLCHCEGHSGIQNVIFCVVLALGRLSWYLIPVRDKFIVQRVVELFFVVFGYVLAVNVLIRV